MSNPGAHPCYITSGVLVEEPELVDVGDGHMVYTCPVDAHPFGKRYRGIILPPAEGWSLPYHKGDVVHLECAGGTAYVRALYISDADHGGHTGIAPRGSAELRLGPREGGAWEALALHAKLAADILALKDMLDELLVGPAVAAMNAADLATHNAGRSGWRRRPPTARSMGGTRRHRRWAGRRPHDRRGEACLRGRERGRRPDHRGR